MFSGIVQGIGTISEVQDRPDGRRLVVDLGPYVGGLRTGSSIAISGVCLTAVGIQASRVAFDLIEETCRKTTLGTYKVGDQVNIERSLRVGDELGGHPVSGHVSARATIREIDATDTHHIVTLGVPAEWIDFIFPKGFIALNGCSLTVVDVGADWFTIHLIPETLRITTLAKRKVGDELNMEIDTLTQSTVETVKRFLQRSSSVT